MLVSDDAEAMARAEAPGPLNSELVARYGRTLAEPVSIVEGEGFLFTAARGLLVALQTLARLDFPLHVADSVPAGAAWCATHLDVPETWVDEVVDVVEQVRRLKS